MKFNQKEQTIETLPQNTTRRRFLVQLFAMAGIIAIPVLGFCQTRAMKRREDRRDDRTDRTQERGENMVERSDDPIGVRGPERRTDRRDLRDDRQDDRRERIY
jgi:flagellar biosynthesis/type III secretory pathway M-ring protein FliF/YscJ